MIGPSSSPSEQAAASQDANRQEEKPNEQFLAVLVVLAVGYMAADIIYIASVAHSGRMR